MKIPIVAALATMALTGCVAVPYYGEPAPAAGYYYGYSGPSIHLRYDYRRDSRDYRPHRYYRHYRR